MTSSPSSTLDAVVARLERVERRLRFWQRGGGLILAAAAAIALMGQSRPPVAKVVEAEKFLLRDAKGMPRTVLEVTGGDVLSLTLADARGITRAWLVVRPDGTPRLEFTDGNGAMRVALDAQDSPHGGATLALADGAAKVRTLLSGNAAMSLVDSQGQIRADLRVGNNGNASLHILDSALKVRASFEAAADGQPAIGLFDPYGMRRVSLGVAADVQGLSVSDQGGRARAVVGIGPDGAPFVGTFPAR